jgi:hypothetical protein
MIRHVLSPDGSDRLASPEGEEQQEEIITVIVIVMTW